MLFGIMLASVAAVAGEPLASASSSLRVAAWLLGGALTAVGVAWALRRVAPMRALALLACGAAITGAIDYSTAPEPWKYAIGVPITLVALAVVARSSLLTVAVLIASAVVSAIMDARSQILFVTLALAGVLFTPRLRAFAGKHPYASLLGSAAALTVLSFGLVFAMSQGLFGSSIAERTNSQEQSGSNIVLGARTEWGATFVLLAARPIGYGLGVGVDEETQSNAVLGAAELGGDTSSAYFADVVFGERVDLHSIVVNTWFHFGLAGLVLAVLALIEILRAIHRILSSEPIRTDPAMLFLLGVGGWHLVFSPSGNAPATAVAVGIAIHVLATRGVAQESQIPPRRMREIGA